MKLTNIEIVNNKWQVVVDSPLWRLRLQRYMYGC
jgi:hypothetical protein